MHKTQFLSFYPAIFRSGATDTRFGSLTGHRAGGEKGSFPTLPHHCSCCESAKSIKAPRTAPRVDSDWISPCKLSPSSRQSDERGPGRALPGLLVPLPPSPAASPGWEVSPAFSMRTSCPWAHPRPALTLSAARSSGGTEPGRGGSRGGGGAGPVPSAAAAPAGGARARPGAIGRVLPGPRGWALLRGSLCARPFPIAFLPFYPLQLRAVGFDSQFNGSEFGNSPRAC